MIMQNMNKPKVIALVATVLMMASILWLMSVKQVNSTLSNNLDEERLRSESLLSEKLLLEKDIEKMKEKILDMRDKSYNLDQLAKNATLKLEAQEAEFKKLKKDNITLAEVKKQREQLAELRRELEAELEALRISHADLEAKNAELSNTIAALEERNNILEQDLNRALIASVDQSQVEAVKGRKDRLTIKARRADKLIANFEVPASLKNLSFRIVDPKGNTLSQKEGDFATITKQSGNNFFASAEAGTQEKSLQTVEMKYTPKNRLRSGVYTVEILNDNLYVSSLKIKLR